LCFGAAIAADVALQCTGVAGPLSEMASWPAVNDARVVIDYKARTLFLAVVHPMKIMSKHLQIIRATNTHIAFEDEFHSGHIDRTTGHLLASDKMGLEQKRFTISLSCAVQRQLF
jgi:hypothetical protein